LAIRILEQTKYGLLARSIKAKSELLKLQAQQEELNAKSKYVTAQNAVYTPEAVRALRNYAEHLRDARNRLKQRERDAEKELARYGVGRESKEKVMREIARVYGEMTKEIEEARKDLERLKRR
jgi:predicted RNA-binding protein